MTTQQAFKAGILQLGWLGLAGMACWMVYMFRPRTPLPRPAEVLPSWQAGPERTVVQFPGRFLTADVGQYRDELFAYLMFEHFRSRLKGSEVLLTYLRTDRGIVYKLRLQLPNDLLTAVPMLVEWQADHWFPSFSWSAVDAVTLAGWRRETQTFVSAYTFSANRELAGLTRNERIEYTRTFVRFKSAVDARARKQLPPFPQPLDKAQAEQLASDIVSVAAFFNLPLDFFLGIGAMENNYHNVKGDIGHSIWKRRAEKGDIVLGRRPGRVLVLNESIGVWQITRETLRYAHRLYLQDDERDYRQLPEHLRPPAELHVDEVDPAVLTTYAGLFFRDLLNHFDGDLTKAVGAYNGGPGKPNPQYQAGVQVVAEYARRVMQHAAGLRGQPVAEMRFLSAMRGGK